VLSSRSSKQVTHELPKPELPNPELANPELANPELSRTRLATHVVTNTGVTTVCPRPSKRGNPPAARVSGDVRKQTRTAEITQQAIS